MEHWYQSSWLVKSQFLWRAAQHVLCHVTVSHINLIRHRWSYFDEIHRSSSRVRTIYTHYSTRLSEGFLIVRLNTSAFWMTWHRVSNFRPYYGHFANWHIFDSICTGFWFLCPVSDRSHIYGWVLSCCVCVCGQVGRISSTSSVIFGYVATWWNDSSVILHHSHSLIEGWLLRWTRTSHRLRTRLSLCCQVGCYWECLLIIQILSVFHQRFCLTTASCRRKTH